MIQILKNPGPKNSFNIGESQFHAIDRLETLLDNIQPQQPNKPNKKVVPREVPMVELMMVPITVPSMRIPMTVEPPCLIEPRVPLISQYDYTEDIGYMDVVESNKFQQKHHH